MNTESQPDSEQSDHLMHERQNTLPEIGSVAWLPKQDARPPRGWWAGGEYMNNCRKCRKHFIGDKRAGHCADCAYAEPEKEEKPNCLHDIPNAVHVSFAKWICPLCGEDISLSFTLYWETLRDE